MKALDGRFYFPIPREFLIRRLKPVFQQLAKGHSAAYLGVYGSGRTSHIRFALSNHRLLMHLIPKSTLLRLGLIFISYDSLPDKGVTTFAKAVLLEILKTQSGTKTDIKSTVQTNDVYLILEKIKELIRSSIKSGKRFIFIFDQLEEFASYDPMIAHIVRTIWQVERNQPVEKVSFLFLASPSSFYRNDNLISKIARFIVGENIYFSPLLSEDEYLYSLKRHAHLQDARLKEKTIYFLGSFLGPIGSCLRYCIQRARENEDLKSLRDDIIQSSLFQELVLQAWEGLPIEHKLSLQKCIRTDSIPENEDSLLLKLGLFQNGRLASELLRIFNPWKEKKIEERESNELMNLPDGISPQEENLLRFLFRNMNKVVSKDEVAEALWGKNYLEKYSDWAMAQLITRLRKKLVSSQYNFALLTLRGRGYKLVK